jgi:hypothetical protein
MNLKVDRKSTFFCLRTLKYWIKNLQIKKIIHTFAKQNGQVAQLVEHRTEDASVGGSNPSLSTK